MASKSSQGSSPASPTPVENEASTPKSLKKSDPASSKSARGAKVFRETYQIGPSSSLEEMEPKVLRFQNRKLAERLEHYQTVTEELRNRNEQLQQRLASTDSEIFIINRHMKSLDENARLLVKNFEDEHLKDSEAAENPLSPVESFVTQLSTLDEEELDKTMAGRVQETRNLISKLVQVYATVWNQSRSAMEKLKNAENVEEPAKSAMEQMMKKNEKLEKQQLILQEKHTAFSLESSKLKDRITELETERDELNNRKADLSWSLDKEQTRREKAENMVVELRQKVIALETQLGTKKKEGTYVEVAATDANLSQSKMGEMVTELENLKTLSANRLQEIDKIHAEKADLKSTIDRMKIQISSPPDDLVINSAKYKSLQTSFSVIFVEHEKLKEHYKIAREAVTTIRNSYLQQLKEAQKHEEDGSQMFQSFLSNLQTATNAAKVDYQRLKIEFEQERASRETSGTNKDYDKLFKSMMQHNNSMQSEVLRLRKRIQSMQAELAKTQPRDAARPSTKISTPEKRGFDGEPKGQEPGSADTVGSLRHTSTGSQDSVNSPDSRGDSQTIKDLRKQLRDKTKEYDELKLLYDITKQSGKTTRELVEVMVSERRLKDENAELRKLAAGADEKIHAAESGYKTLVDTVDNFRSRNRQLEEKVHELEREKEKERSEKARGGPDEELQRKVKFLEDSLASCKKALQSHKIEEEAMMSEMEITGQALEDLQNQNKQLIDQLKEKDNTNLKWMSDNIRNNQIIKTLKDEKIAQEMRFRTAVETIQKYEKQMILAEERIKAIEDANTTLEEDRKTCDYMIESWKRKAHDQTKEANDLRLKLEQLEKEVEFARTVHADRIKSHEGDVYKTKRLTEENAELKRRLERAKLVEITGSSEEILKEDLREYKDLLNCPSCKCARKDTVLTKCFHVFCNSCISKRYETRQRRCPQCGTSFGANDYRRLYLA
ncbi:E3 ubiquitin-protein ligase Bre1-like [Paramacrobiotus metropolitanus]|uniref:E3 ubiquitin-protein ligase Bre1-like n=1 Tax=Paramacrobiotus metropolitanus TaxID=2943436 RepID=UPI0024456BDD|nr:E3 ubiquitin-protein ligase Bre1-like [Paramacrobiotus metropolitanus]XP_055327983.1 E3 ubiquitin-protein ligase Bre1-like [Paramacrobiotus metropolitanus]